MPGFVLDVQGLELAFKNRVGVINAGNNVSLPSAVHNTFNLVSGRGKSTDGTPLSGDNDIGVMPFTIRCTVVCLGLSLTYPGMRKEVVGS